MLLGLSLLLSCSKSCPESEMAVCQDTPPTDEDCLAYFQSWFYDSKKNTCEKIGYSGCSPSGFESQEACEACKCN